MASKEKTVEPVISCRSTLTNFVRDMLLGMIIAAFVLVYGTFGMASKHHHQHDDATSLSTYIMPAFRSLLKFMGDGCLGLAVATSVLAYGTFSKLVAGMTVVVNGADYSCISSRRSRSQEIGRIPPHHHPTSTKRPHCIMLGRPNKGVPCKCSRRFPQHILSCNKFVCMRVGCGPLRAGERLLLRNKQTLSRCASPDLAKSSYVSSPTWSSTLTSIIEEQQEVVHQQPHQQQAENILPRRLTLPASLRFAGHKILPVQVSSVVTPIVKRY